MKVHLGGLKFQTDDELKRGVLGRLRSQDKTPLKLLASATWQDDRKSVSVKGEYLEKE
jgi:hypothetical protein